MFRLANPGCHTFMSASRKSRARVGRPPAGARTGEKVTDYPQLSVRLPPSAVRRLQALAAVSRQPQWRIVTDAIQCLLDGLPDAERRKVDGLVKRSAKSGAIE
jgi:hypothetical protein